MKAKKKPRRKAREWRRMCLFAKRVPRLLHGKDERCGSDHQCIEVIVREVRRRGR